jgi:dTDP-4-amino-4,6-dideoxygalactose transaminase
MIKLFTPYVHEDAIKNATRVLRSGQLAEGKEVKYFEYEFAKKFQVQNVVAVNSGTSALELAYELAQIGEGDEVITPVLTCTATNIPLVRRKARIIFADIDEDLNISIEDVKRKITPKTKAIVFVHFGGNNRGLKELQQLGIPIIEDGAQAVGSNYWGNSDYTAVSLQAIKTLTSGDGGFLLVKNDQQYNTARRLRWFGYDRELKQQQGDTDLTEAGYKYHMNDITASIGRGNLVNIDGVIQHRKDIGEIYKSYGMFAHAWMAGGFTKNYNALHFRLQNEGVEIGRHHYRNDKYTIFKQYKNDCPTMDRLENSYYFAPLHHLVTTEIAHNIGNTCKNLI